ncbi:MAG: DUF6056 family protein [Clostridia bacterium]|nr:DUF6056 family protein [Clostridia bacterium]
MKTKTKDNLFYILLFIGVFFVTFMINKSVSLYGDDFYYAVFSEQGFLKMHIEHYKIVNGRAIVHLLATIFLMLPMWVWQVVNSLMLATITAISAKIASAKSKLNVWLLAFSSVLLLGVDMTRESVYWLTGSFNYVYPFMLLVIFWYLLFKKERKPWTAIYILAFFSAATTEQNGMMTLGIVVLYILDSFFTKHKKVGKNTWLLLLPVLAGFVSVYLSPATFVRYGLETDKGMFDIMKETLPMLFYDFFAKKYMVPFAFLNFAAMGVFILRFSKKPWQRLIAYFNILAVILVVFVAQTPYAFRGKKELFAIVLIGVFLVLDLVFILVNLIKNKPNGYLAALVAVILAFGSQLMMSVSPAIGPRTMLAAIFSLVIFDLTLIRLASDKKFYRILTYVMCIFFLVVGAKNHLSVYRGYDGNAESYRENERIISEYKKNPTGEISLYIPPNPDHCWSMPHVSTYHEGRYKIYYGLDLDTKIEWK